MNSLSNKPAAYFAATSSPETLDVTQKRAKSVPPNSNKKFKNTVTQQPTVLAESISLIKVSETLAEIFNCKEPDQPHKSYLGLGKVDMVALFGPDINSKTQYVVFGNEIFTPLLFEGLEQGSCVITTSDFKKVKDGITTESYKIFKIKHDDLIVKEATIAIAIIGKDIVEIENKKQFKAKIKAELANLPVRKDASYIMDYYLEKFSIQIQRVGEESTKRFGTFTASTKLKLRRNRYDTINIEGNLKNLFGAELSFHLSCNSYSTGYVPQAKVMEILNKKFSSGGIIIPGQIIDFEHNGKNFKIKLKSIATEQEIYDESYELRTKRFCIRDNCKFKLEKSNDVEFASEAPVKAPEPMAVSAPKPEPAPIKPKYELQTKGKSFKDYLEENGMCGVPLDLMKALDPLLGYYSAMRKHAERRGIKPEKGVIFYGPPGNGKTTYAELIIGFLNVSEDRVFKLSCSSLLGGIVGDTEKAIRTLFESAKNAAKQHGKDSPLHVIFLDELDAIFGDRANATHSWESSRVAELLTQMAGINKFENILVMAATNFIKQIDSALLRHGRFGCQIHIDNPNFELRKNIFGASLKDLIALGLVAKNVQIDALSEITEGFSAADITGIVQTANNDSYSRVKELFDNKMIKEEEIDNHPSGIVPIEDLIRLIRKKRSEKGLAFKETIELKLKQLENFSKLDEFKHHCESITNRTPQS